MAEFPSLPMFVAVYLADTGDLSIEEHGAYHLMLYIAWLRPDNALPNDMAWLKRAMAAHCSNLHGLRFNRVVPRLLTRFWWLDLSTGEPGIWRQKRLEKEREFLRERSKKQTENINKRWSRDNENNDLPDTAVLPGLYPPHHPHTTTEYNTDRLPSVAARDGHSDQSPDRYPVGSVTISDPVQRLARFQQALAQRLGSRGMAIVLAASDANDPQHAHSLALCKATAKALGKGWPHTWEIIPRHPSTAGKK